MSFKGEWGYLRVLPAENALLRSWDAYRIGPQVCRLPRTPYRRTSENTPLLSTPAYKGKKRKIQALAVSVRSPQDLAPEHEATFLLPNFWLSEPQSRPVRLPDPCRSELPLSLRSSSSPARPSRSLPASCRTRPEELLGGPVILTRTWRSCERFARIEQSVRLPRLQIFRCGLTPRLTPLRAQRPQTPSNHQQGNRLSYADFATYGNA